MNNILITSAGRRVELIEFFKLELESLNHKSQVFCADLEPNLSAACQASDVSLVKLCRDKNKTAGLFNKIGIDSPKHYSKESFLMMYRYHSPDISLSLEVEKFLETAVHRFARAAILTDGRSVTQRLKLNALGLRNMPVFISEEYGLSKPDNKRFVNIMDIYSDCREFCYIADNPSKDFIAPNSLDWISICLEGDERNIHSQDADITNASHETLPQYWQKNLKDMFV